MKMKTSNKSRLVAILLSGLLGGLGIHRMVVGRVGTGVAQLLLTISFIGIPVSAVWNLVDFIMIACGKFKDKDGKVLVNW